ncbi:MFS transporter [Lactobacillus sp. CBA3605]|uniref:MFS transporter n=1 Tax=Lactobacillus sp. CBA3605 TaxID=2099788 RepID=UPI001F289177|nr:MFS transporter [Lactobacillus sp. CBA3605]
MFNIILLTYAKSFTQPKLLVSVVSVATVLPSVFGVLVGRAADQTKRKPRLMIQTKLVQAALYLVLAQVINQHVVWVFYVVVAINMSSDTIGNYGSSLFTLVLQGRIVTSNRQQALGLNQSVSTLVQPVGQACGVAVMAATHNYALAGDLNAIAFLLSAVCLQLGHATLKMPATSQLSVPRSQQHVWPALQPVLRDVMQLSAVSGLGLVMGCNLLANGLTATLNLFFINRADQLPVSYSVAILLVNFGFVGGTVVGGLTKQTWVDRLSIRQLIISIAGCLASEFLVLLVYPHLWAILLATFSLACLTGKLDPKFFALIMVKADPQQLGAIFGLISTVVMLATPIGSLGFVLSYNIGGATATFAVGLILALVTLGWLQLAKL